MDELAKIKSCELHAHLGGCLTSEDVLDLAKDVYKDVDWSLYVDSYQNAYHETVDVVDMIAAALNGNEEDAARFADHYIVGVSDAGDFMKFQAKFNLIIALYRHYAIKLDKEEWLQRWLIQHITDRHRSEGIHYIEYRANYGRVKVTENPEPFIAFHRINAQAIAEANTDGFEAKYVPSLDRENPLICYNLVQQILSDSPELADTIVGFDFCDVEEGHPPTEDGIKRFFQVLAIDNARKRGRKLEVAYHVGETFFDKSLESAVRWCHQAAIYGAKRLGHAIALGLDPVVAIKRRENAHENETVSERLNQIAYDIQFADELEQAGIDIDVKALKKEKRQLEKLEPVEILSKPYDEHRLYEIGLRQRFVLQDLAEMGTVIESCPTSNLLIGGVPRASDHPIRQFLASKVNLAICADDPGIFGCTLADEVEWVVRHNKIERGELASRLGLPQQYRLGG